MTPERLYEIRHSLAHVLAQAVCEVRPGCRLAFGPPVDNGCYYDFDLPEPLTPDEFPGIESRMRRIIAERQPFEGRSLPLADAVAYLEGRGESFKVEYCRELGEKGETEIGFYRNGPFDDMCAGPHVRDTGEIPADGFAVDSLAGAYWRGDEKRPQLTRVYVLAFGTAAELEEYRRRRELAKERDHRKLAKELDLVFFSEDVGAGLPLWTPAGTAVRDALEDLARETEQRHGYERVVTPHLTKASLYHASGHLPYYTEGLYPPMKLDDDEEYYLKPMNCPHHHAIFAHRPRSYRELPVRFAEYGTVYRYEPSGSLSGILRVRCLCMNDAHIYCTPEQLFGELVASFEMTTKYYAHFRFENVRVRLSTCDPARSTKFVDDPEMWRRSEETVRSVLTELGISFDEGFGEAAFYGPKIDFQASTGLGREETVSTSQLDFAVPKRMGLSYVGPDGGSHVPFVIHRAPLGTHERFVAFLLEHFGGAFPTWMAPVQARVIPVAPVARPFAEEVRNALRDSLFRTELDDSDGSFNKRIRDAVTRKIPNILVVGAREAEARTVTLRRYCTKEQINLPLDRFVARMHALRSGRVMDNFPDVEVPS